MTISLHRDYETRSVVNLKTAGAHVYAAHWSTEALVMSYAVNDGPVKRWLPGEPCPPEMVECANNPDWESVAHNHAFESAIDRLMAKRHGWPIIPRERQRCTMAQAYAMSLPGSLENCAAAVGLEVRKDQQGRKIMEQMCKPRKMVPCPTCTAPDLLHAPIHPLALECPTCHDDKEVPVWLDDPDRRTALYAYCDQDVEVERENDKRLLRLTASERELWVIDQEINDRGITIDRAAVEAAIAVVEVEKKRLDAEIAKVTNGAIRTTGQAAAILAWARTRGVDLAAMTKTDVTEALALDTLPADVRRALELRKEGAQSSTAKFRALLAGLNDDDRYRGFAQYHGAGPGRWAGRRAQLQNLKRPSFLLIGGDPDHTSIEAIVDLLGVP